MACNYIPPISEVPPYEHEELKVSTSADFKRVYLNGKLIGENGYFTEKGIFQYEKIGDDYISGTVNINLNLEDEIH
jgi:hypothetical protein